MGERDKLLELADRCEREAENWYGEPMCQWLRDIAKEMRTRAASLTPNSDSKTISRRY